MKTAFSTSAIATLEPLLRHLPQFSVNRFAFRLSQLDCPQEIVSAINVAQECILSFYLGEKGFFSDSGPYAKTHMWAWREEVVNIICDVAPIILRRESLQWIDWKFVAATELSLSIVSGAGLGRYLLPIQLELLRELGLDVVSLESEQTGPKMDPNRIENAARGHYDVHDFGPHLLYLRNDRPTEMPFWWSKKHDDLIKTEVIRDQFLWFPDYKDYVAIADEQNIREYILAIEKSRDKSQFDKNGYVAVWYNQILYFARERALAIGAVSLIRKHPVWRECPVCSYNFFEPSTRPAILGKDQLDICKVCLDRTMSRVKDASKQDILNYFVSLTALLGGPPTSKFAESFAELAFVLAGRQTGDRAGILKVLHKRPDQKLIAFYFGTWLKALIAAGVLSEDSRRTGRGIRCLAVDGHQCLSLGEKLIDDLLFELHIPHSREVPYASGNFRGDFLVGKAIIEYLGLMQIPEYAEKARRKIQFCQEAKIPLLCLYPKDIVNKNCLGDLIENFLFENTSKL